VHFVNSYQVPRFLTSNKCRTQVRCWDHWLAIHKKMRDRSCVKYSKVYPNYRHKNDSCINQRAQLNKCKYIKLSVHKIQKTKMQMHFGNTVKKSIIPKNRIFWFLSNICARCQKYAPRRPLWSFYDQLWNWCLHKEQEFQWNTRFDSLFFS
jgi:hypothetical protein